MLLLCVVLLVAAPHELAADVDAQSELAGDELVGDIVGDLPALPRARIALPRAAEPMPTSPALGRIDRPPRPSFE